MLMSTAFTLVSDIRIRNAFLICSALAPPPTSRKFAGSPPASLMMSIVAIASPAPLTMQPIGAIELDVVERELRRLDLERLLFADVAQLLDVGVAVERVVVEVHLRVEREEAAVLGDDQRVDLDERGVGRLERVCRAPFISLPACADLRPFEAERERELARLIRREAERRDG